MTPYQSARTKQLHKFFHHVRHIRKEIQLAASIYSTPNPIPGNPVDQWLDEGDRQFW